MVAEKRNPKVDQLCFCRIFQTVRNLQKGTTGMSSEGQKMMEGGMGHPGVGGKCRKTVTHGGGRSRLRRPDPGASGCGWPGNFTGVVVWSSSSSLADACTVVVARIGSHG